MTTNPSIQSLPLAHGYNLARLGNVGDTVVIAAGEAERAAIAKWSGIVSVEAFQARVEIKKLASDRFELSFHLAAELAQSCVVTLEPVKSSLDRSFTRELHFTGPIRHKQASDDSAPVLVLDGEEEGPEEIENLNYDLAGPLLEEFVLSLEPYPRRPGAEFAPQTDTLEPPESPFAVLKDLK